MFSDSGWTQCLQTHLGKVIHYPPLQSLSPSTTSPPLLLPSQSHLPYQSLNIGNDVQINSKDVCVTATCKHSKDIYMHKQLVTNASLCNLKHTAGTGPHVGT